MAPRTTPANPPEAKPAKPSRRAPAKAKTPRRTPPKPTRGERFVKAALADYDLTRDELELLEEIRRTLDQLDDLHAAIARDGVTTKGSTGQLVVHPALSEARQSKIVLLRLLVRLGLDQAPDPDPPAGE